MEVIVDHQKDLIRSYRDLRVWQEAMDLAEACYRTTRDFPKEELYGITSQMRRAAVSVAANIAEGHGREGRGEFVQFLRVAQGSLKELETHLLLSHRVGLASKNIIHAILGRCEATGKMLRALIRSLQKKGVGNSE
jgi:four helix bundle protein